MLLQVFLSAETFSLLHAFLDLLYAFSIFLFKWELSKEKEKQSNIFNYWFVPPNATTAGAKPGRSQELIASFGHGTKAQTCGPLASSCIGRGAARTQPVPL